MGTTEELIAAKIAKIRSSFEATYSAQLARAVAEKKPQGPKGRSNNKAGRTDKARAAKKAAHKSRMAQKRKKG